MKKIIYAVLAFAPVMAFAQSTVNLGFGSSAVTQISHIVSLLIPIAFALAILYFFWGLAQFVLHAGDEKKTAEGKRIMIYGVVAIAVMASLFGIVAWLQGVFNINGGSGTVTAPTVTGLQ